MDGNICWLLFKDEITPETESDDLVVTFGSGHKQKVLVHQDQEFMILHTRIGTLPQGVPHRISKRLAKNKKRKRVITTESVNTKWTDVMITTLT